MYSFNFVTGPTSFAPIIETAIGIVDSTGGQYHVLLIIADGQVGEHIIILFLPLFQSPVFFNANGQELCLSIKMESFIYKDFSHLLFLIIKWLSAKLFSSVTF